jgi:HEAT repeat protein
MNSDMIKEKLNSSKREDVASALRALSTSGQLSDLQTILKFVKNADYTVKVTAIDAACTIIRENLINRFNDFDPETRKKLSTIMETLDPAVIEGIKNDIYGEDDHRRVRAIQVLGLMKKNPVIEETLAEMIQDRNERIRATAIHLLGNFIGPHDHEVLMALLRDPDKRVRANTIEALESLRNKRLVPILLKFRKDPNNRIRGNVLKALYNLGYTSIEEDLLEMLQMNDDFMKASGFWVVTQICLVSQEIIDIAGFNLLSENEMVQRNARNALEAVDDLRAKGYLRYLYQ